MQWFLGDNLPSVSGRYLVYSNGVLLFADYETRKKYFTSGQGMDCDEIIVDAWCDEPKPVVYMWKEIGGGEWSSCNKTQFEHWQKDPTIDTKTINF